MTDKDVRPPDDVLEDFWGRRRLDPSHGKDVRLFGRLIRVRSNDDGILSSLDAVTPLYSAAPPDGERPFRIQIAVDDEAPCPPGQPDADAMRMHYAGSDRWAFIRAGDWAWAHVDLESGIAHVVVTRPLAEHPEIFQQKLLNTLLLNLFIGSGLGMLHASCVLRGERAVLLLAPHNAGKSTTALKLVEGGYRLLTDSMVFVRTRDGRPELMGFPVGRIKLREDMMARNGHLRAVSTPETVRNEVKYSVDLRAAGEERVRQEAVVPETIDICILAREERGPSRMEPIDAACLAEVVRANSLFYDSRDVWTRNMEQLGVVLGGCGRYRLTVGGSGDDAVGLLNRLVEE